MHAIAILLKKTLGNYEHYTVPVPEHLVAAVVDYRISTFSGEKKKIENISIGSPIHHRSTNNPK